jgi:hypothetical protein
LLGLLFASGEVSNINSACFLPPTFLKPLMLAFRTDASVQKLPKPSRILE